MVVTIFFYAWMCRAKKYQGRVRFEFDKYPSWTCLFKGRYGYYDRKYCLKLLEKFVWEHRVPADRFKLQGTSTGYRGFPIREKYRYGDFA